MNSLNFFVALTAPEGHQHHGPSARASVPKLTPIEGLTIKVRFVMTLLDLRSKDTDEQCVAMTSAALTNTVLVLRV